MGSWWRFEGGCGEAGGSEPNGIAVSGVSGRKRKAVDWEQDMSLILEGGEDRQVGGG